MDVNLWVQPWKPDDPLPTPPIEFPQLAGTAQGTEERLFASDATYPDLRKARARTAVRLGAGMFVISAGLFSLYCWWASWAPEPPPGHWVRYFGWLIHGVLLVLMAGALAGAGAVYASLRQLRRIRHTERATREMSESGR